MTSYTVNVCPGCDEDLNDYLSEDREENTDLFPDECPHCEVKFIAEPEYSVDYSLYTLEKCLDCEGLNRGKWPRCETCHRKKIFSDHKAFLAAYAAEEKLALQPLPEPAR